MFTKCTILLGRTLPLALLQYLVYYLYKSVKGYFPTSMHTRLSGVQMAGLRHNNHHLGL